MTESKSWYDRDDFWENVGPLLFSQRRRANAPQEVERIIAMAKLQPGASVLDLCCGVGRHSLELARRGFHVTGVDRTRAYLDEASRQAASEGLAVEFVQKDMRRFRRTEAFDAAINLFTSFGYFHDPEDDRVVARNVYQSLRSGGAFVIDMMGKEVLSRVFRERDWQEMDGFLILEERKLGEAWASLETRWIVFRGSERFEHRLWLRLYSAVELISLLKTCGFAQVDVYGDLEGSPYDHTAKRLVAVARK